MDIENTKLLKERSFTPEMIGNSDMLIAVRKRDEKNEYTINVSLAEGQYEMSVTESQLQKLRDGTYKVTIIPSGLPMLEKVG